MFTIGHSTCSLDDLIALLRGAGLEEPVDVRPFPRSRTNPQVNVDSMPAALAAPGIGYRHAPALRSRRPKQRLGFPSPNGVWINAGFRSFADYALAAPFRQALADLLALSRERTCTILCTAAVWPRCHRPIIADWWLRAAGADVLHIPARRRIAAADLDAAAHVQPDGAVHYPLAQGSCWRTTARRWRGCPRRRRRATRRQFSPQAARDLTGSPTIFTVLSAPSQR